ncbi:MULTISPECIES: HlyD family secretion protein [Brevundimonas]|mgnify:FL=1|jgi:membrane fusion protein (multidrug efflux system)|uniref:HlyD family secretion protein n=1 Tax=Brevundimonas TaxID=41275 RepID=UPI0025C682B6|nr:MULTISPECIES: HlyD family secretion protein [Brevundimonas]|tara:strand:+ start:1854 stop:2978 length:1125 start_codon:yes stop_codon:yes gene_type:complete
MSADALPPHAAEARKTRPGRRKLVVIIAVLLIGLAVIVGWLTLRAGKVNSTDARIAAHVIAVSSEVSGRVVDLQVRAGQRVRAGQILASIDPADSRLALERIDAEIARIEAQQAQLRAQQAAVVRRVGEQMGVSAAGVSAAQADALARQAEVAAARSAFDRSKTLFERGLVAQSRFDEDQARLRAAEQNAARAQAQIAGSRAQVGVTREGTSEVEVLEAQVAALDAQKEGLRAQRGQQTLDLGRREIRAAFDGVIDQTFIDAGEFVTAGTRLLMYHNPSEIWIDVNIKETDVRKITVGAPARVKIDAYPGQVFDARVSEVGGAATSQFALLPNPNPSGNFTKVTQRIPVRLEIVQQQIPLRPGMMVEATIDVVD